MNAIIFPGQGSQFLGMMDNLIKLDKDIKKIVTSDIKEFTSYLSLRPLSANKKSLEIV